MTGPGFGLGCTAAKLLRQQFVKLLVFHIHFGAFHRIDHNICGCVRAMGPLRRSLKPVIVLRGQEHELTAAIPGYFDRLASRYCRNRPNLRRNSSALTVGMADPQATEVRPHIRVVLRRELRTGDMNCPASDASTTA